MQRFDITKTAIEGVYILKAKPIGDERGYFERFFCAEEFKEIGLKGQIAQMNLSLSERRGTLRGMHYQMPPYNEFKIVRCLKGALYDVAVDIRKDSPTFLQHVGVTLSEDEHNYLVLPHGTAHGFITLTDNAQIMYLLDRQFCADAERGINPFDKALNIKWPAKVEVISRKDENRERLPDDFAGIEA